jgi:hypothetical protein
VATVTVPALDLSEGLRSARAFTEYLWLTVLVAGLVALTKVERLRGLDLAGGNLCYGVYLNHFLVAGLLLGTGAGRYLGSPGTLAFGFAVLAGSIAMAALTYVLVERPFDRVRARVRGDVVPQAAPSRRQKAWRPQVAIVAGAAILALFAHPAGLAVGYVNRSPGAELAPSPVFNIRWREGVTAGDRIRFETELGLIESKQDLTDTRLRTWSYRLPAPREDRVRAILRHKAVEDTAGIDREHLVIQ